ncbi:MAG TPA: hypothetical protein VF274_00245 [Alphaproteobacteria bacterium]|jgi:hypothetical protein
MMRWGAAVLLVVAWGLAAGPAMAEQRTGQNLSIKAFRGNWTGSAVSNNRDSIYFGVTIRDLDFTLEGDDQAFTVHWTTVMRRGGTPDRPNIRRKETTVRFVPAASPGVWRGVESGDPLAGKDTIWGRVRGRSLILYFLDITDTGTYALSRYVRTLSGSGMDLEFTLIVDGEPVRTVRGKMVKQSN